MLLISSISLSFFIFPSAYNMFASQKKYSMRIFKFGGTSVETAERTRTVKDIINTTDQKIVVLSANGKATDWLDGIISALQKNNRVIFKNKLARLRQFYEGYIQNLFQTEMFQVEAIDQVNKILIDLEALAFHTMKEQFVKSIIAKGELISTALFSLFLDECSISHIELYAPDIIQKHEGGEVNLETTRIKLNQKMTQHPNYSLMIIQGFICSDHGGKLDNLGRGGSDYTATILGYASDAQEIQLWSDVDGFLSNDPGLVQNCFPLKQLSYYEAAELAYFGARILHPRSLFPAQNHDILLRLKNTLNPKAKGTLISSQTQKGNIKAVAGKDGITSITIHSGRMLMAYGFLKSLFQVFEVYKTPVDMVTTSEVSVSVTIDDKSNIDNILTDLRKMGEVEVRTNMSIVCVVGDQLTDNKGQVSRIFQTLDCIPVRMISYGASKNSITFLVDKNNKAQTMLSLQSLIPNLTMQNLSYVL